MQRHHALAFAISEAVASWAGALYAFYSYSLVPTQFGFGAVVVVLAAVALGGRSSVLGPVFGAAFLAVLPEVSRVFANQRLLMHGVLLVVMSIYMPNGLVEALKWLRSNRQAKRAQVLKAVPS